MLCVPVNDDHRHMLSLQCIAKCEYSASVRELWCLWRRAFRRWPVLTIYYMGKGHGKCHLFFCFCCVNFVLCSIPQPPCLWLPFLPPFELFGKFWSNSSVTPGTNPGKGLFIVASISDLQANASCGCIVKVSNCLLILRGQGERIRAHAIGKRIMEWYTPGLHFRLHPSSLRVWAYNTNYTWRRQCFVLWCSCVFTACCWCENRAITRQNMFNHSKKIFSFVLFVLLCKVFPISKGCLFVKKKNWQPVRKVLPPFPSKGLKKVRNKLYCCQRCNSGNLGCNSCKLCREDYSTNSKLSICPV